MRINTCHLFVISPIILSHFILPLGPFSHPIVPFYFHVLQTFLLKSRLYVFMISLGVMISSSKHFLFNNNFLSAEEDSSVHKYHVVFIYPFSKWYIGLL